MLKNNTYIVSSNVEELVNELHDSQLLNNIVIVNPKGDIQDSDNYRSDVYTELNRPSSMNIVDYVIVDADEQDPGEVWELAIKTYNFHLQQKYIVAVNGTKSLNKYLAKCVNACFDTIEEVIEHIEAKING